MSSLQGIVPAQELETGDIIGINVIPAEVHGPISVAANLLPEDLQIKGSAAPNMRAVVLTTVFNASKSDTLSHIVLLPIAPVPIGEHVPNTQKTLMVTHTGQLRAMGLDNGDKWRLIHTLFALPPTPEALGAPNGSVHRYGRMPEQLQTKLETYFGKLHEENKLLGYGVLDHHERQRMSGNVHRQPDARHHGYRSGNTKEELMEASDAARIRQREVDAERAARKAAKLAAAKEQKRQQKQQSATPSGKLAVSLGMIFSEASNPDISLENALTKGFLGDQKDDIDVELALFGDDDLVGRPTLRTLYDMFSSEHERTLQLLEQADFKGNIVETKARMEAILKEGLVEFYRLYRDGTEEDMADLAPHIVPFQRAPAGP